MTEARATEMIINGVVYVPKGRETKMAVQLEGMEYVIVRTQNAGVFAGYLVSRTGEEAVLREARRIWYWDGAATLSQLATDGTSKPQNCKFPCAMTRDELTQVIEVIPCTEKARLSIQGVAIWKS
jgi:hypothetical protein